MSQRHSATVLLCCPTVAQGHVAIYHIDKLCTYITLYPYSYLTKSTIPHINGTLCLSFLVLGPHFKKAEYILFVGVNRLCDCASKWLYRVSGFKTKPQYRFQKMVFCKLIELNLIEYDARAAIGYHANQYCWFFLSVSDMSQNINFTLRIGSDPERRQSNTACRVVSIILTWSRNRGAEYIAYDFRFHNFDYTIFLYDWTNNIHGPFV